MSNNPVVLKCSLCDVPYGISFTKEEILDKNYCYVCGENILKLKHAILKTELPIIEWANFPMNNQIDRTTRFNYQKALSYYINKLK